jgi:hypothetical protein
MNLQWIVILVSLLLYGVLIWFILDQQRHQEGVKAPSRKESQVTAHQCYYQQINDILNQRAESPRELIGYYLSLKDLYYGGIPDKYDLHGNKIRGIPPNPQLAIHYLQLAIQQGYQLGWIDLGRMYHYGFYNFPSNLEQAMSIYQWVMYHCLDPQLVQQATQLFQEVSDEHQRIHTHRWLNLPYTTSFKPLPTRYEMSQKTIKRPLVPIMATGPNFQDQQEIDINQLFRATEGVTHQPINVPTETPRIQNDMHNVHDHSVIATIKQSLDRLSHETTMTRDKTQSLAEIRQHLNSQPPTDKTRDALMALDTIERSYLPITWTDLSESDVLSLVWNRMNSDLHHDNLNNLKDTMVEELASCIEHDKPVCATGRLTRMVDTLNAVDQSVNIKPTYAVNEEMMTVAAKLRQETYDHLTEKEKVDVDSLAPNDFQKQWTQQLKDQIVTRLQNDYVKSDLMTQTAFETETKKWIDEL